MTPIERASMEALYERFPLNDHTMREGNSSKSTGKIQWFTYLERPTIQRRLESIFPGEWSFEVKRQESSATYASATVSITIRGIVRENVDGQSTRSDDPMSEDVEKGAVTSAFRRAASMWGIGLYLYEVPPIWTEGYRGADGRPDWNLKRQRESEAWAQFVAWYNRGAEGATELSAVADNAPAPNPFAGAPNQKPAPHRSQATSTRPNREPGETVITHLDTVTKKTTKGGKPFLSLKAITGEVASVFGTSELESARALTDVDAWLELSQDQSLTVDPPVGMKLTVDNKGYFKVTEFVPSDPTTDYPF